jgi:hypothetical protein
VENTSAFRAAGSPEPANDNRKELYMAAIHIWIANMKGSQSLSPENFKKLDALERILVTRNGLIANLLGLCRADPRQDCRMAVLAIITYLADNDEYLCRLSVKRFAQLLCRAQRNIQAAIDDLEYAGVIGVNRSVTGNSYWPRVSPDLINSKASVVWFVDALSDAPKPVGRPRKKYPVVNDYAFTGESVSAENTLSSTSKYPVVNDIHTSLRNPLRELDKGSYRRAVPGARVKVGGAS